MTFFVNRNDHCRWPVYGDTYSDGSNNRRCIRKAEYPLFGFNESWDVAEARAWAKRFNKKSRQESAAMLAAKRKVDSQATQSELLIPLNLKNEFQEHLKDITIESRRDKVASHWKTAQELIVLNKLSANSIRKQRKQIFLYLESKQISLDYSRKLIRVLNLWSEFVCEKNGDPFLRSDLRITKTADF